MDRRRRDLTKVVLDRLVAHQIVEDNSRVVSITPDWDDDVAGGRIIIEVKRARAPKRREAGTPAARGLDLDALTEKGPQVGWPGPFFRRRGNPGPPVPHCASYCDHRNRCSCAVCRSNRGSAPANDPASVANSESTTQPARVCSASKCAPTAKRNIGRIIDVLAGRRGGIEDVVVEFGGFLGIGTRKVAIKAELGSS
jgi:hypothetical protein